MKKHLGRAWTAFLVVCFPLHALLRILSAKSESETASWPFFGIACFIGSALVVGMAASFAYMDKATASMTATVFAALYAFAMVSYFGAVLKSKGNVA